MLAMKTSIFTVMAHLKREKIYLQTYHQLGIGNTLGDDFGANSLFRPPLESNLLKTKSSDQCMSIFKLTFKIDQTQLTAGMERETFD